MELAYRAGLGASVPRPLSQLRPCDGQFRVQDREGGAEGVLAASHTGSDGSTEPDLALEIGRSGTTAMNATTSRLTHRPLSLSVCKRDSGLRKSSHSATNTETNPRALNGDNKDGEIRREKVRRPAATSELQTSVLSFLVVALLFPAAFGQANNSYQTTAGEFRRPVYVPLDRSEEDWSFLKNPELRTDPWDPLKYISLRDTPGWYLTLAGEERSFYELYRNYNWGAGPQDGNGYYLNRFLGSADFHLGSSTRFFFELECSLVFGRTGGPGPVQDEEKLGINQLFIEFHLPSHGD